MIGRRAHAPVPGEPQPDGVFPRSQGGGGAGFVNVAGRLFAPLQGLDANNVTQGGYSWLSLTDGGATYHPGVDLNTPGGCNADEGAAVVAPLAGTVREVLYAPSGEGNHVWVELGDPCCPGPTWLHVDHLLSVGCRPGQALAPGEVFGQCGRTGGWDCAHLHTELLKGPPATGFFQWPYGWSRASVEEHYYQPIAWWNAARALVLAEADHPVPPEVTENMSDWELTNFVLGPLYEWAGLKDSFNPDGGIQKTWVAAVRAGHYPGRPRTGDLAYGDPVDGWWAEFEHAVLIYQQDGAMSWTG